MANTYFRVEGIGKLLKDLEKLRKIPQKHVTASARKGMNIALRDSKANAPYDTGQLKKGIKLAGEKAKTKSKKVYRIVFDRAMNDVFQKKNSEGEVTGYYPISQEYGFFARNGRYIPGFRFISDSLTENTQAISKTMKDTMKIKIDKEIAKAGLR